MKRPLKPGEKWLPQKWGTGFITNGNHWQHPYKARARLEGDGRILTIRLNQAPDTAFSWGGRTTVGKKSVRGFVHNVDGQLFFTPYKEAQP